MYLHCIITLRGFTGFHYNDVIMSVMASQITSLTIVYSTVYSRRRSKKIAKLRVIGLCEWNSPVTGEFPAQRASDMENVFIWWRHRALSHCGLVMPYGCRRPGQHRLKKWLVAWCHQVITLSNNDLSSMAFCGTSTTSTFTGSAQDIN